MTLCCCPKNLAVDLSFLKLKIDSEICNFNSISLDFSGDLKNEHLLLPNKFGDFSFMGNIMYIFALASIRPSVHDP